MLDALRHLDYGLLKSATDLTANHAWLKGFTYVAAQLLIVGFFGVLLYLWHRPEKASAHHGGRKAAMLAIMGVVGAVAAKTLVVLFWVRPRPFLSHPELFRMDLHGVDPSSFPSAHTMIALVIATSLLLSGYKKLGWILVVLAIIIGLGRIFSGVHYPSDVLGGAIFGIATALYLHREASEIKRYLPNR